MKEIRDKERGLGEVLKEVGKKVREAMEEAEMSRGGGIKELGDVGTKNVRKGKER